MTSSPTKPALILSLLLVICGFCSMAIAGGGLCPGQIKPAWVFLGCARGTFHAAFISQRKLALVALIDIKLRDVCQSLFWPSWHESTQA